MKIEVYSDGSGNTFDSDGGWGFCLVVDGKFELDGSGYLPTATNNTAELNAAIEGLVIAQQYIADNNISNPEVILVSDSQLVLGYANGKYKCKAIHLAQLYIKLKNLYESLNADVRWIRGHSGDEFNEMADKLAGEARINKGKDETTN